MSFLKALFSTLKERFCNHDFEAGEIPYISEHGKEYLIYECRKCNYAAFPENKNSFVEKLKNYYNFYSIHNKILRDYNINK